MKTGILKDYGLGYENPFEEWNEAMIRVEGGREAYFFLNGQLVNDISNIKTKTDGQFAPAILALMNGPL